MFGSRFDIFILDRRQISEELFQVALVIAQSMRAHVALVAQMVEELSEKVIDHLVALLCLLLMKVSEDAANEDSDKERRRRGRW
jgi:hypothetical protein